MWSIGKALGIGKKSISNNSERRLFYFILIVPWTLNFPPHHAVSVTAATPYTWWYMNVVCDELSSDVLHAWIVCAATFQTTLSSERVSLIEMIECYNLKYVTAYGRHYHIQSHSERPLWFHAFQNHVVAHEKISHHFVCTDGKIANQINDSHNDNQFGKLHRSTFQFRSFFGAWAVVTCAFCWRTFKKPWWICSSKF